MVKDSHDGQKIHKMPENNVCRVIVLLPGRQLSGTPIPQLSPVALRGCSMFSGHIPVKSSWPAG